MRLLIHSHCGYLIRRPVLTRRLCIAFKQTFDILQDGLAVPTEARLHALFS